jgi:hypothetical protein
VLIPNPKPIVDPVKTEPKVEKKFLELPADTVSTKEPVKPAETMTEPVKTETTPVETEKEKPVTDNTTPTEKKTVVNNCRSTADDGDFLKLRRKMVSADNDDDMVTEARKYFKSTCFTVYQVRNLSTLFLSDEGKYKFFDAAYTHTSDVHNFISLQLELKEGYWVKRFKAMLK